jgi:hypothetical protein
MVGSIKYSIKMVSSIKEPMDFQGRFRLFISFKNYKIWMWIVKVSSCLFF